MTEGALQALAKEMLGFRGFIVTRVNSGRVRARHGWVQLAPEGTADLICCCPNGRYMAVELKLPGKNRTTVQEQFGLSIAKRGGLSLVISRIESLEAWLNDEAEEWQAPRSTDVAQASVDREREDARSTARLE